MAQVRISFSGSSKNYFENFVKILEQISDQILENSTAYEETYYNSSNDGPKIVFEFHYSASEKTSKTAAEIFNERVKSDGYQKEALAYIVVVMLFYSITIVSLMIKYMKLEKRSVTEDQMYQDFLTKTKQVAKQQVKADLARRVSLQLVSLAHMGSLQKLASPDLHSIRQLSLVREEKDDNDYWSDNEEKKRKFSNLLSPNDISYERRSSSCV